MMIGDSSCDYETTIASRAVFVLRRTNLKKELL